jgi:hypothetical protein
MDKIDLMFGKIALKNKFLDQDDLQRCAKARKKSPAARDSDRFCSTRAT